MTGETAATTFDTRAAFAFLLQSGDSSQRTFRGVLKLHFMSGDAFSLVLLWLPNLRSSLATLGQGVRATGVAPTTAAAAVGMFDGNGSAILCDESHTSTEKDDSGRIVYVANEKKCTQTRVEVI